MDEETIQISLCLNNPNNGEPMRQLWAIDFDSLIHLESNIMPDPGVTCYRCDDHHVRIGRRKFPIIGYAFWVGNWCWDAIAVSIETANNILAYIQSLRIRDFKKYGLEEAQTELWDAYEHSDKIDLSEFMDNNHE